MVLVFFLKISFPNEGSADVCMYHLLRDLFFAFHHFIYILPGIIVRGVGRDQLLFLFHINVQLSQNYLLKMLSSSLIYSDVSTYQSISIFLYNLFLTSICLSLHQIHTTLTAS